jgi:hypothetical protein
MTAMIVLFWSRATRRPAWIPGQLRPADQLAQGGKETVGVNGDIEPAMLGGMDAGEPAGPGISRDLTALAVHPYETSGLDRQCAAQ